jgi:hypothetical protein
MVTEPGNFYAILIGSLQNTRFGRTGDSLAVNAQSDGFQLTHSQPGKAGIDDLLMSLRSVISIKIDCSTLSLDSEALDGRLSTGRNP